MIFKSLESTVSVFRVSKSPWNLTGVSAAVLQSRLPNFKAMRIKQSILLPQNLKWSQFDLILKYHNAMLPPWAIVAEYPTGSPLCGLLMMTSSNRNIFRVTSPLWEETTGLRWIPLIKASDAELSCFLWSAHEQTVEQTIETLVIWDAIAIIMTSL